MTEETVKPNDIYLLCSDGLNDMVNDEEIRLTLSKYSGNLAEAATELVRLANDMGGKDNIFGRASTSEIRLSCERRISL